MDLQHIHPSAKLGTGCKLGHFIVIHEGVQIGDEVEIGDHVVILPGTSIGDRVVIGPNSVLGKQPVGNSRVKRKPISMPGLQIGAGAVVTKDVPAASTVMGNPARPLLQRNVPPTEATLEGVDAHAKGSTD